VVEISQRGAGWSDIAGEVLVLIGLIAVMVAVVAGAVRRLSQQAF
jgi:hypothetical protein